MEAKQKVVGMKVLKESIEAWTKDSEPMDLPEGCLYSIIRKIDTFTEQGYVIDVKGIDEELFVNISDVYEEDFE